MVQGNPLDTDTQIGAPPVSVAFAAVRLAQHGVPQRRQRVAHARRGLSTDHPGVRHDDVDDRPTARPPPNVARADLDLLVRQAADLIEDEHIRAPLGAG